MFIPQIYDFLFLVPGIFFFFFLALALTNVSIFAFGLCFVLFPAKFIHVEIDVSNM